MSLEVQVRDKRVEDNDASVRQVRATIVVVDENRKVVNRRTFRHDLDLPEVTQETVQARLDEEKERALSEARTAEGFDLEVFG